MSTTYGRSPGGYVWAILEPAAGIGLLTFLFSLGFRSPPLGTNFPIFYATGLIAFLSFFDVSSKVSGALTFSKPLLAYPRVTYLDAIIARFLVGIITQLMVASIIFGGILIYFETRTVIDPEKLLLAFSMITALALGVGTMNSFLFLQFPVAQRVWSIINRPLVILSCIFFLFETVPQPYRDVLWYVPTVHLTGLMRSAFYPSYDAVYVSAEYVFGIGCITFIIGLVFLRRYSNDLLNQ